MDCRSYLNILLDEGATKEYAETYGKIVSIMASGQLLHENVVMHTPHFFSCVIRDMKSQEDAICTSSMQALSCCLKSCLTDTLENKQVEAALSASLLCAAEPEAVKKYFETVTSCCKNPSCINFAKVVQIIHSTVFEHSKHKICQHTLVEIMQFISRIDDHEETQSDECHLLCLKVILLMTADCTSSVRKVALEVSETFLSKVGVKASFIAPIAACLKQQVVPKIKFLYSTDALILKEILTQQWPLILRIMGISIKKSSSLMNALLAIVESGFRHPEVEMKKASFKAWNCLINCYAEDLEVLSSSRYMKLLMQPLMTTQASDELNLLKVEVLWNLACKLKSKLAMLFSTVCVPLLHTCLGNLDPKRLCCNSDKLTTPLKSRNSSGGSSATNSDIFYAALHASGYKATPRKASKHCDIQMRGVEILMHLLEVPSMHDDSQLVTSDFKLLNLQVLLSSTPRTFSSHGTLFITAVSEVLCHMGGKLSDEIILSLWSRLSHHINFHLEATLKKKKKETELFNLYLRTLQNVIISRRVRGQLCFFIIKGFLKLPEGILSSTFYGGSSNGMHGVPALCLLNMLFSKPLINDLISDDDPSDIATCACELISCGMQNKPQLLSFCESVVKVLRDCLGSVTSGQAKNGLLDNFLPFIWIHMGTILNKQIVSSQEVNQGDSLEHDFAAMYAFMLFPCFLPCHNINDCFHTWVNVYKSFLWCASLVTTVKHNEICQYISMSILAMYDETLAESKFSFFVSITLCLLQNAEFNHGGFPKPSRLSYSDTSTSTDYPCDLVILDVHKNLQELFALLKLLFIHLQKLDIRATRYDDLMEILCFAFTNILNVPDVLCLFRYFLPVIRWIVVLPESTDKLRGHFRNVIRSVQRALLEKSTPDEVVVDFHTDPDILSLICCCIKLNDCHIKQSVVYLWQEVVINGSIHDKVCNSLSDTTQDVLLPLYDRLGWQCPWRADDVDFCVGEQNQENVLPVSSPSAMCGAFGPPLKINPGIINSGKSEVPARGVLHVQCGSLANVNSTSPFPNPCTPLTNHLEGKKVGSVATLLDGRERNHPIPVVKKKEKFTCRAIEKVNDEAASIFQSVTTSATSTPKDKNRTLANTIYLQEMVEEDSSDQKINLPYRSDPAREELLSKEDGLDATKCSIHPVKSVECKRAECGNTSEEPDTNFAIGVNTERDTLMKLKNHSHLYAGEQSYDAVSDSDVSYEYIEIVDASTNQTEGNRTFNEETDDVTDRKDLGVTPLDDSYEYVAVVDTSMNVTSNLPRNETLNIPELGNCSNISKDPTDTNCNAESSISSASEYEDVAVVDMSTFIHNKNATSAHEKAIATLICSDNLGKNQKKVEKTECSEMVIDVEYEHKKHEQQKHVIVEVADVSTVGLNSEMSAASSSGSEDENGSLACKQDVARSRTDGGIGDIYELGHDETGEIQEYGTDDEYADVRASLGSIAMEIKSGKEEGKLSEVVNISSSSTTSDSLFETSQEDVVDASILSSDVCNRRDDFKTNEGRGDEAIHRSYASTKNDGDTSGTVTLCSWEHTDEKCIKMDQHLTRAVTAMKNRDLLFDGDKFRAESSEASKLVASFQTCWPGAGFNAGIPQQGSPTHRDVRVEGNEVSPVGGCGRWPKVIERAQGGQSTSSRSPGGRGILKRRFTVSTVTAQVASPKNNRRVSFAEPISKSKRVEGPAGCNLSSPRSSLHHRNKHSPRAVNRRLSLPVEKKCNMPDSTPVSPLSLRSAKIAEAIANIRAKRPDSSASRCSDVTAKRPSTLSMPASSEVDFGKITMENLCDPQFLSLLKRPELEAILHLHIRTTTTLYETYLKNMKCEDGSM